MNFDEPFAQWRFSTGWFKAFCFLFILATCGQARTGQAEEIEAVSRTKVRKIFEAELAGLNSHVVGLCSQDDQTRLVALGTLLDREGWIVTKASEVAEHFPLKGWLHAGESFAVTLEGINRTHDLALLRFNGAARQELELSGFPEARRDEAEVGEWIYSPAPKFDSFENLDLPGSVGVVSAEARKIPERKGRLGLSTAKQATKGKGLEVTLVAGNSGASRGGVQIGDHLVSFERVRLKRSDQLGQLLADYSPGDRVKLEVLRDGRKLALGVTLTESVADLQSRGSFQNRISHGISSRRFDFPSVLTHDGLITPELCGGPVFDIEGRFVGINIARAGRAESYLIPASIVLKSVDDLKTLASHSSGRP